MGGERYLQATLALKAWLELQFRIVHELFRRAGKMSQKYKWTETGLEAKPISGLFVLLDNFENTLNSETAGKVAFPDFAGPGKTRIRVRAVGNLFSNLEANRAEYLPNMWDDPSSLKTEQVQSELVFIDEVRSEAETWFAEKGATDGKIAHFTGCRLRVEDSSQGYVIHLDGTAWHVSDRVASVIEAAIQAKGRPISMSDLGCRTADLNQLPKQIRKLLITKRGSGTRLADAAWQS